MLKSGKITETLACGYSFESTPRGLSNEYQHDRVKMVYKNLCLLMHWKKVASALQGLIVTIQLFMVKEKCYFNHYQQLYQQHYQHCRNLRGAAGEYRRALGPRLQLISSLEILFFGAGPNPLLTFHQLKAVCTHCSVLRAVFKFFSYAECLPVTLSKSLLTFEVEAAESSESKSDAGNVLYVRETVSGSYNNRKMCYIKTSSKH